MARQLLSVCHIELAKVATILLYFRTQCQLLKVFSKAKSRGRYAASTNIASAVRKYRVDFPNLHKQTAFEFKKAYLKEKGSYGKGITILKAKKNKIVLNFFAKKI